MKRDAGDHVVVTMQRRNLGAFRQAVEPKFSLGRWLATRHGEQLAIRAETNAVHASEQLSPRVDHTHLLEVPESDMAIAADRQHLAIRTEAQRCDGSKWSFSQNEFQRSS